MEPTTFVFTEENATIGNLLQNELLKDDNVLFAAFNVPHPQEKIVEVAVLVSEGTPSDALKESICKSIKNVEVFEKALEKAFKKKL